MLNIKIFTYFTFLYISLFIYFTFYIFHFLYISLFIYFTFLKIYRVNYMYFQIFWKKDMIKCKNYAFFVESVIFIKKYFKY